MKHYSIVICALLLTLLTLTNTLAQDKPDYPLDFPLPDVTAAQLKEARDCDLQAKSSFERVYALKSVGHSCVVHVKGITGQLWRQKSTGLGVGLGVGVPCTSCADAAIGITRVARTVSAANIRLLARR